MAQKLAPAEKKIAQIYLPLFASLHIGYNWITVGSQLTQAEVLLKIDNVLGDHDGILNVGLNPLQALDALVTGVPAMKLAYER